MEARNRILNDWYGKIQRSEIKLPRFQRYDGRFIRQGDNTDEI